jgi:hypothetical protein
MIALGVRPGVPVGARPVGARPARASDIVGGFRG